MLGFSAIPRNGAIMSDDSNSEIHVQGSQKFLQRPNWSNVRALYKSMGYSDYDLERPLIGIANSWNRATPGHYNLNSVSEYVKQGIFQAGGTPVEFGIIGPCDGMGVGNAGMRFCLPARDVIANEIEVMVRVNNLDAVVSLGSCDKIVPGLLMAAARLNIPAIVVNGGPMLGGMEFDGRESDNSSLSEALGMLQKGLITRETYDKLEDKSMPCCGSCSFLGTANTMGAFTEALGMCLPGTSLIPAVMADRYRAAQVSGRRIVSMVTERLNAGRIITYDNLVNAFRLGMAIGGSTNLVLHFLAIAYEAGFDFSVDDLDRLSRTTPHLARIYPACPQNVPDFYEAGGVQAVMKHLEPLLNTQEINCTGKSWKTSLESVPLIENDIIHPLSSPWHEWGSVGVLKGNLAPRGGISKPIAIDKSMLHFRGTAICFNSEEDATKAVEDGIISPGMVLVIRYEGPKGGPGMREMARIMKMLYGQKLATSTAVVTDGRFSGTNNGCFVGHVSPEAAEGGPIAAVQDGDIIEIDVAEGTLTLDLPDAEITRRLAQVDMPIKAVPKGYLNVYSKLAQSADKGAIIENR
jgi:dihydroxy-acid dehydratase